MKKQIRFVLQIILFIILLIVFGTTTAQADIRGGNCGIQGDNITWELDTDTGKLEINGEGDMYNWTAPGVFATAPWYNYRLSIITVVISNNVTSIGNHAFYWCENLTDIIIPETVTTIGHRAFGYCGSLESITIPENVTSIGVGAFFECKGLTEVTIPKNVTNISDNAFYACKNLKSAVFEGNAPATVGVNIFSGVDKDFTIYYYPEYGWPSDWNGYSTKVIATYEEPTDEDPDDDEKIMMYGDLNDDKDVGLSDLVILARHIAEIDVITDPDRLKAADVTGDDTINVADLIRLSRWIAGLDLSPLGEPQELQEP